jgi:uncharacterized membrane protein (UPF0127 family)
MPTQPQALPAPVIGLMFLIGIFCLGGPSQAASTRVVPLDIHTHDTVHRFTMEIAATPHTRAQGLQGRHTLAHHHGMLFLFPAPTHARFWMKNTPLALDMLFIDADNHIIYIAHHAAPYSLKPLGPNAAFSKVVEIAGGQAKRLGISVGDRVTIPLPKTIEVK